MLGLRWEVGVRPFVRRGGSEDEGWRCARRYGWGVSFAKVVGGNERVGSPPVVVIMACEIRIF